MGSTDTERANEAQDANKREAGSKTGAAAGNQRPEAGIRRQSVIGADRIDLPGDSEEETKSAEDGYHTSGSGARTGSTAEQATVMRLSGSPEPATKSKKNGKGSKKNSRQDRRKPGRDVESPGRKSSKRTPDNQREDREQDRRRAGDRRYDDRDRSYDRDYDYRQRGRSSERYREPRYESRARYSPDRRRSPSRRGYRDRKYEDDYDRRNDSERDRARQQETREPKAKNASKKPVEKSTGSKNAQGGSGGAKSSLKNPFHVETPVSPAKRSVFGHHDDVIADLSRSESKFVHECVERWMKMPELRAKPLKMADLYALDTSLIAKREVLHEVLTREEPVADALYVEWTGAPVQQQSLCYAVTLGPLGMAEQVAVLQTALFDAGYSIKNVVPAIKHSDTPFDLWSAPLILAEVARIRNALEEVVLHIDALQEKTRSAPDSFESQLAKALNTPATDPNAIRRPASLLSSSEAVSRPTASEETTSSDRRESLGRRAGNVEDDGVVNLRGAGFFQRRGLGWRSDEGYEESTHVPSPHRAKPPAFDEPMPEAPMYAGVLPHATPRAPTSRRNVMAREPEAGYTTPVANPVLAPTFVAPVPAPQPHFSAPTIVQQQPTIVYPRPFVPAGYLEPLTGEEPLEDRRQFLTDYEYMARTAMWSDEEMCQNIFRYVKKPVLTYIRQLGSRAKSWRALKTSITQEFIRSHESPMERYCSLGQDKNESARHFLWRLNAAADRAQVDLRSLEGMERHVTRFTRALRDSVVKSKMSNVSVRSVKDLDEMLRLHELRTGSDRSDGRSTEKTSNRDRDREYDRDRDRDRRDRSASRPKTGSTYWAYQEDYSGNEYVRQAGDFDEEPADERTLRFKGEDEYFEDPESEEGRAYRVNGQGTPVQGRVPNYPTKWPGAGPAVGSKFRPPGTNRPPTSSQPSGSIANANTGVPPTNGPANQAKGMCFNCGQYGHWAAECPSRQQAAQPVCPVCSGPHSPDSCWKKCPACTQVHVKPEDCAVVRAIEDLKAWYKSPANAGSSLALPTSVLQHMDKPLN